MIEIKRAQKVIYKYGARKYAEIPSFVKGKSVKYTVVKVREKSKKGHNYVYRCRCPRNFYNPSYKCKHIKLFIELENKIIDNNKKL